MNIKSHWIKQHCESPCGGRYAHMYVNAFQREYLCLVHRVKWGGNRGQHFQPIRVADWKSYAGIALASWVPPPSAPLGQVGFSNLSLCACAYVYTYKIYSHTPRLLLTFSCNTSPSRPEREHSLKCVLQRRSFVWSFLFWFVNLYCQFFPQNIRKFK